MRYAIALLLCALTAGCSTLVYTSAAADNMTTFAAIRTSTPQRQVVEGNPLRKSLIATGPTGAIVITAALDYLVIKACDALEAHGHPSIARGIKVGIIAGHAIGVGNNLKIVLDARHKR